MVGFFFFFFKKYLLFFGYPSAALPECAGPEFKAGQEGLFVLRQCRKLERVVSMVTPEALSNPELAMAS